VSGGAPLAVGSVSLRLYPHDLPAAEQLAVLRAQARLGVEAGYDGVMVSEHHGDFPGYLPNPVQMAGYCLDAMPTGWAAACPLLLPMKPYALVAEEIAWTAAAYPGRFGAGFAAGAVPVDFELAEVPFDEIVERFKASLPRVVAALRGADPGPLGRDRAVARCAEHPVPMVVAAQSLPAVRRAARLGVGILYDSLQTAAVGRRLSDAFDDAGGGGAKVLIRRVWIGDAPTDAMAAQLAHYHRYANEHAAPSRRPPSASSPRCGPRVPTPSTCASTSPGCPTPRSVPRSPSTPRVPSPSRSAPRSPEETLRCRRGRRGPWARRRRRTTRTGTEVRPTG
jgi:alkanesulfonate monooxygenase SsuD/methylene tetrahydromethanopterin reductase-like flavin-dependent oxidoreductase (luciferase family)